MPGSPTEAKEIFLAAIDISEITQRAIFIEQACAGDAALRGRVEKLLNAYHQSDSPFERIGEALGATLIQSMIVEQVGTMIGPYKLKEEIGEGGFGRVFVAEQQQPIRRKVAIKVIKPGMDTRDVIARFEAERQALALMDHPNIAKVLDAGTTEEGRPYFVMELVRGVPITDYCDQNQLTPRERLELFVSVCNAIQHAHMKGVIHRDVKPSNVMVALHDGNPVVKVIDFGIAKALHQPLTPHTVYTRFFQLLGTPLYMSPEQAQMNGLDVDTRTDVYSLGVLLYELLTGMTPVDKQRFAKIAQAELLRIICDEVPARPSLRLSQSTDTLPAIAAQRKIEPSKLTKLFHGDLDWITMKALEKDRTRRYETANAFATDVLRYLNNEPVEACPPSTIYLLSKLVAKHRRSAMVAATILVVLLLGSIGTTTQMLRAQKAERLALESERSARQALNQIHQQVERTNQELLEAAALVTPPFGGISGELASVHNWEYRDKPGADGKYFGKIEYWYPIDGKAPPSIRLHGPQGDGTPPSGIDSAILLGKFASAMARESRKSQLKAEEQRAEAERERDRAKNALKQEVNVLHFFAKLTELIKIDTSKRKEQSREPLNN